MFFRWILPVLVLPGTTLVGVPALVLWLSGQLQDGLQFAEPYSVPFILGLGLLCVACALAYWTGYLFVRFGSGTAAPWDPPKKLVVRGPYRHVRNPMIIGVICFIAAEALFLQSWGVGVWALVFSVGNAIYIPLSEEKALARRFGQPYEEYRRHVGRWIPRLSPWKMAAPEPKERENRSSSAVLE